MRKTLPGAVIASKLNAPTELDPYAVLGLEREAAAPEIQRQYKRLAKQFHPDLNPEPEAGLRMKAINDAYAILGDPLRREAYDRLESAFTGRAQAASFETGGSSALSRYDGELDNELSVEEALFRRQSGRELRVRKVAYRSYEVASLDRSGWFPVTVDRGCRCLDARGAAGPFGCKHWHAMEAFRNNGDKPVRKRPKTAAATR